MVVYSIGPDWFVAGGTLALAAGTGLLAFMTWRSVETATEEVRLERQQIAASQWPRVFPAPALTWSEGARPYNEDPRVWQTVLPVTNGGPGVALDVRAALEWPAPGGQKVETVPTSLAPHDSTDLRINWGGQPLTDWGGVKGSLMYRDIQGGAWHTEFRVVLTNHGRSVEVGDTIRAAADAPGVGPGGQSLWRRILRTHNKGGVGT